MHHCLREIKIDYVVDDWMQVSRQKTRLCVVRVTEKTVEDLFEGGTVNIPESTMTTFKTAKTGKGKKATQTKLFD